MTRVTNDLRASLQHKIMAGLPVIDYAQKIHETIQKVVIRHAPPEVQDMYVDEGLRRYLNEVRLDVKRGNSYVQMYNSKGPGDYKYYNTLVGLTKSMTVQMDENTESLLKEGTLYHDVYYALKESQLVDKYFAQDELRDSVKSRLRANLRASKTFKQLYANLEPELHHYIPKDEVKAQVPACVAPVVDDLRKLGADLPTVPKAAG